jgi:predicted GIY-YIG superfamily endonuclease
VQQNTGEDSAESYRWSQFLMFWVYILQNLAGHFYIGHTDNLVQRVANHNRTDKISGKFTRKNGSWTGVVRRAFQSFEREAN